VSGGVVVNDMLPVPAVNIVTFSAELIAIVCADNPVPIFIYRLVLYRTITAPDPPFPPTPPE
jgi:hypothetical protein